MAPDESILDPEEGVKAVRSRGFFIVPRTQSRTQISPSGKHRFIISQREEEKEESGGLR